jgi:N-acetylglucosamine kinase-like BadF-type ATPase
MLCDRARLYLGGVDIQAAYRLHTRTDAVAVVAGFAIEVARSASEGDDVARRVLENAIAALANTAATAAAVCGSPVVSWSGRMFELGAQLIGPLTEKLASSGIQFVAPAGGPLDGAMALCRQESSLYSSMVATTGEWVSAQ